MTEQELKAKLERAERKGIELGIQLMQEKMLLACENGTPIELPDGRAYFIKSDMQNLLDIFADLESDADLGVTDADMSQLNTTILSSDIIRETFWQKDDEL